MTSPFVRKLRQGAQLSTEDEFLLTGLSRSLHHAEARHDIYSEGDRPGSLTLILKGWACRDKILENGQRQIIAFFLPGDLCEPFGVLPPFMNHSITALTPVTYARLRPEELRVMAQENSSIEQALWWDALAAMELQHEHVVSLGRRQAVERLGHLFCELHMRLSIVVLADKEGFFLPVTQQELGDALGLSAVHVNRSLRELRSLGFVNLRHRRLDLLDLNALKEFSLFDPAYLRFNGQPLLDRAWSAPSVVER